MGHENSARESELAANLYAALVASKDFQREFLRLVDAHEPDASGRVDIRFEYTPGTSNKRFDIYLSREDPSLRLAVELKRNEAGLEEEQLREYLSLLGVLQPGGVLRRRRGVPRYAKLVAITGATEQPEVINNLLAAGGGFLKGHLGWLSWFELMDCILDLKEAGEVSDAVDELSRRLEEQGFVSRGSPLPRLRAAERLAPKLMEFDRDSNKLEEVEVLSATLGRLEYQMAKLDFGVTVHVTAKKRNKFQTSRKRTLYVGKPVKVLGQPVKSIGRKFLPNDTIQAFIDTAKKTSGQEAGVGIAFSISRGGWVAFIKPLRGRPLPAGFIPGLASGDREVVQGGGIQGWLLKGRQKQPESTARFLVRAWANYMESTIPAGA
jgi:hypothetical protein